MKKNHLDNEEIKILNEIEAGKYKTVKNIKREIKKAKEAAKNTLLKTKNINIRISLKDLQKIKAKAAENNLPYQTLISSLIRQYIQGKIQIVL
jgi:predicted DNA binding CopG/RHH family protein